MSEIVYIPFSFCYEYDTSTGVSLIFNKTLLVNTYDCKRDVKVINLQKLGMSYDVSQWLIVCYGVIAGAIMAEAGPGLDAHVVPVVQTSPPPSAPNILSVRCLDFDKLFALLSTPNTYAIALLTVGMQPITVLTHSLHGRAV